VDRGKSFGSPVKVAEAPVLPLNRHRGPRVVIARGTIVVTAVTGQTEATGPHAHGLPSDGDLIAWRSVDGGGTWSLPVRVNDVSASAREGLHALASDGRGTLFAVWLDLREEGTRLFGASSNDGGATWSENRLVYASPDGTICQCCHPSAAFSEDGALDVMWRNCLDGARDLYVIRSTDLRSFAKPVKLGDGTWKINACPMDGGGLTHVKGRTVTVWRRESAIYQAEPGRPERKLGDGKDVAITSSGGLVYAMWVDGTSLVASIDGSTRVVAEDAAFPSLVALPGGGVLAAWQENGGISVAELR
jgi:hypothetical protein